jgi:hypothetical protein
LLENSNDNFYPGLFILRKNNECKEKEYLSKRKKRLRSSQQKLSRIAIKFQSAEKM